jgi:type IV pilus assembly protein PilB
MANLKAQEKTLEPSLSSKPTFGLDVNAEADGSDLSELWNPGEQVSGQIKSTLENRLRDLGYVSNDHLEQAKAIHRSDPRKSMGQILLEMGVIQEADLLFCIAEQYDLSFIRVSPETVETEALQKLDKKFIETHNILPLCIEGGKLVVGTPDPTNIFLLDEVRRNTGMNLEVKVCPSEDIKTILTALDEGSTDFRVDEIIADIQDDDIEVVNSEEEDLSNLEQAAGESPIIRFVNAVIQGAIKEGASDIHIEPGDKKLKVRYRVDGVLFSAMTPPHAMHAPVVSRIKIMSNLDIAERRLPQDGRIQVVIRGRKIDMRVSTLPTAYGEKVVIRILDTGSTRLQLDDLGMNPQTQKILHEHISQPHGIILVTGPTGSGKSTTLYAALATMDSQRLNISTVEDPVEYQVNGISQVQVHERIGMSFAAALRSLLRQDPDVIMVGEIRDEETARIAIQASLTGHLVLSTLHTNDAPSSITRLINIGVEPFLIAAATNAVLAQRLVRRMCRKCQSPYKPKPEEEGYLKAYGFALDNIHKSEGCDNCRHTGYQGRAGIYELLSLDETYRDIITNNPTVVGLRRACRERKMITLREDGFRKVEAGITTIDEVMRVTEAQI